MQILGGFHAIVRHVDIDAYRGLPQCLANQPDVAWAVFYQQDLKRLHRQKSTITYFTSNLRTKYRLLGKLLGINTEVIHSYETLGNKSQSRLLERRKKCLTAVPRPHDAGIDIALNAF